MRVAYLVNQYPHVSHSFIRREIAGAGGPGLVVERFSIRPSPADLVDPADQAERQRTQVLLAAGVAGPAGGPAASTAFTPAAALAAGTAAAAIRLGRRSERGVLRHLVYLAEACVLRPPAAGGRRRPPARPLRHQLRRPSPCWRAARRAALQLHRPRAGGVRQPREPVAARKDRAAPPSSSAVSDSAAASCSAGVPHGDWPKIHVVRCGVDAAFPERRPAAASARTPPGVRRPAVRNRRANCCCWKRCGGWRPRACLRAGAGRRRADAARPRGARFAGSAWSGGSASPAG